MTRRACMCATADAKRAALELVLHFLDRFAVERAAAVAVFGGCPGGAAKRPPVLAILDCAKRLLEGEDVDVRQPKRKREPQGRRVDYACRALLRTRLPDLQQVAALLPKKDNVFEHVHGLALAALYRYARELPETIDEGHFDVCKLACRALGTRSAEEAWPEALAAPAVRVLRVAAVDRRAGKGCEGGQLQKLLSRSFSTHFG